MDKINGITETKYVRYDDFEKYEDQVVWITGFIHRIREMTGFSFVIIRTGRDIPLKLSEEYKGWKGFVMGVLISAPTLILMVVHALVSVFGDGTNMVFGKLTDLVNMVFYWIINLFYQTETIGTVYYNLIFIAIFAAWFGFSYMLGARKVMLQYESIERKHRQIHGDE